jgi:hypothetical protein
MAICDSKLYFSRNVKVYVEPLDATGATQGEIWEIPVLDGFSFAQANNSSEITLQEMESASGVSRRGQRTFNDSLAPAEWSFSTYTRPFKSAGGGIGPDADSVANVHAVEEVLWALAAGKAIRSGAGWASGGTDYFTLGLTESTIDFETSNTSTLGTANIYFVLEDTGLTYRIRDAVVNEVVINFDIDGIAMLEWSGMGAEIVDDPTDITPDIVEGITDTTNFIRNRLTALTLNTVKNADVTGATAVTGGSWTTESLTISDGGNAYPIDGAGQTYNIPGGNNDAVVTYTVTAGVVTAADITTAGTGYTDGETDVQFVSPSNYTSAQAALLSDTYNLTLTGGSISLSNNISYVTPEELGIVNIPIGHVTGTRAVSGNFTTYLVKDVNSAIESADFWADAKALTTVVTHSFNMDFAIGGASNTPRLEMSMPYCHIEIPTHSVEDVISMETTFTALGSCISAADELRLTYAAT